MSISFSVDEMLSMAERVEVNGARFYRAAAAQVSDDTAKESLNWLAAQEDEHKATFARMRQDLKENEVGPPVWDPDREYDAYVQALADGKVFDVSRDPETIAAGFNTLKDILEFALDREKDSIVFYMILNKVAPANVGKEKIQGILDEEIVHVALITKKLAAL